MCVLLFFLYLSQQKGRRNGRNMREFLAQKYDWMSVYYRAILCAFSESTWRERASVRILQLTVDSMRRIIIIINRRMCNLRPFTIITYRSLESYAGSRVRCLWSTYSRARR